MSARKKILLSGVKPTGRPHIGNYFGAMRENVALSMDPAYEGFVMIADYHALTGTQDGPTLREWIVELAADYRALGLDPARVALFQQSAVPAHTEAAWVFSCVTSMPYLMRAHAFKDAEAKNRDINVGTFTYPMLMAADILLYGADAVPVGQDQKQHVEIARDTAEKFNRAFGATFSLPEPVIRADTGTVPGLDGRKMSKSYGNTIPLFAEDAEIDRLVMSIVTDSAGAGEAKDPEKDTVFALHRLFSADALADLAARYREGSIGYRESKEMLAANLKAFVRPLREKRREVGEDRAATLDALARGAERARERAAAKLAEVRARVGVALDG